MEVRRDDELAAMLRRTLEPWSEPDADWRLERTLWQARHAAQDTKLKHARRSAFAHLEGRLRAHTGCTRRAKADVQLALRLDGHISQGQAIERCQA